MQDVFGKDLPAGEKIGESWELADLPNDKSVIVNGELAGWTIDAVLKKYPEQITGDRKFTGQFPLLIKLIDAEDILSVQVHPDEQTCKRLGRGSPKTECWYIIRAEAGAVIYKGLRRGVTKEQFAAAIKSGTVGEMLEEVPVEPGECHFLPAGTAHAIGPGLLIAEIQAPSDTTYRVFDWNRLDESGKSRQLHIAEALESIHFGADTDRLGVTTVGRLADCPYFKVDKGHQAVGCEVLLSPGKMKTLVILTGFGTILAPDGRAVEFRAGDTILVPAAYEGAVRFGADSEYLTVTI